MVIRVREADQAAAAAYVGPAGGAHSATLLLSDRPRVDLFGVLIDQVDQARAIARVRDFLLAAGRTHQVVTVNLDFLYLAEQNPEFRETINAADLAVADGMPLVWLSRVIGSPLTERVTGVELVRESCRLACAAGVGVFFLGGTPSVAAIAAERVRAQYPGLAVSHYAPPFGPLTPEENGRIVEMVQRARPGFLFVALGAPRQDLWIRDHRDQLQVPVAMGVGCVVDLLAGVVRRAPAWMQATGFEWSYRLMQEPRRLWRRYLLDDLPHLGRLSLMALDPQRAAVRARQSLPPREMGVEH
jgi:N-acetylglucosaminyldiphosphoundecaprenol N-acetyl-beta-D-mannosaminyltransferase